MALFLSGQSNTNEIKSLFESAEKIKCAVAFWGNGAWEILERCDQAIKIICNLECGGTNPNVIRKLNAKKNIEIKTHSKIHAKVYLAEGRKAIVGSANMSSNGLSLEDKDIEGWIESGVLITEPEPLTKIDNWFDDLWKNASKITEDHLKKAEELWTKRRHDRPCPSSLKEDSSLLTILHDNREIFKDREIFILIWREKHSKEADAEFQQYKRENKSLPDSELGLYENWDEEFLPPGAYMLELYHDQKNNKRNAFTGVYQIPEHPIKRKVRYETGGNGFITICFKSDHIKVANLNLKLNKDDKKLLKGKIKTLWNAEKSTGDDEGKTISLYEAWPILFE